MWWYAVNAILPRMQGSPVVPRSVTVGAKVTPDERRTLEALAHVAGLSRSTYMRELICEAMDKKVAELRATPENYGRFAEALGDDKRGADVRP